MCFARLSFAGQCYVCEALFIAKMPERGHHVGLKIIPLEEVLLLVGHGVRLLLAFSDSGDNFGWVAEFSLTVLTDCSVRYPLFGKFHEMKSKEKPKIKENLLEKSKLALQSMILHRFILVNFHWNSDDDGTL